MSDGSAEVVSLVGLWRRTLLRRADVADDTDTAVHWLQARAAYADLRQPADLDGADLLSPPASLTRDQCLRLATQEGFAGHLRREGDAFVWYRSIDFQPSGESVDAGYLEWQGALLIERGRDAPYLEHWVRDEPSVRPVASAVLAGVDDGVRGLLVRAGAHFMYVRDRRECLAPGPTLAARVASAPDLTAARRLIDCEIAYGRVEGGVYRLERSSLPYRVGDRLMPRAGPARLAVADRDPAGHAITREWRIVDAEGPLDALVSA